MLRRDMLAGLASVAALGGCSSGGGSGAKEPATGSGQRDLVVTLERERQFTLFLRFIRGVDYAAKLQGAGPFTLFAPHDAAMGEISQGDLTKLLRPQSRDKLRAIVDRHIVAGLLLRRDLMAMKAVKTIDGTVIEIARRGQELSYGTGGLLGPNIGARNGVIHVIDRVQVPPRLL